MHQPIARAALAPSLAAVSGRATNVLLVEEDAGIAAVTAAILADEGYQMDQGAVPAAALALCARHGPHAYGLVLSDAFARQHTQAYTWCDRLRTVTAAPVVPWSTAPPQVYADDRWHGAAAVVSTPFDVDALLALLATPVPHALSGRWRPRRQPGPLRGHTDGQRRHRPSRWSPPWRCATRRTVPRPVARHWRSPVGHGRGLRVAHEETS